MMRSADDSYDLEAHYGSTLASDTDDDSILRITQRPSGAMQHESSQDEDAPSYLSTSYFGLGVGDESTVGAMTTDSSLIRGNTAYTRNANLGQHQGVYGSSDDDDNESPSYGPTVVGKDYSLYDLNGYGDDDGDESAAFENVDLESPTDNKPQQQPAQAQPTQEQALAKPKRAPWSRFEWTLVMIIACLVTFLASWFLSAQFL